MPINSAQRVALLAPSPDLIAPAAPPVGFVQQTQVLDLDGLQERLGSTAQSLGIANAWSWSAWVEPRADIGDNEILFEYQRPAGNAANRIFFKRPTAPADRFNVVMTNSADTVTINAFWNGFFVTDEWVHILVTWDGTTAKVFKNGVDLGAPDTGNNSPGGLTQVDDAARVPILGNGNAPNDFSGWNGLIAQQAWWRVDVGAAALDVYANGDPSCTDLNVAFGDYSFQGDLAHWWRLCVDTADIGKDSAAAGFTPTIDMITSAVGIDATDCVTDGSPYVAQANVIDFDGATERMLNSTPQAIGIANAWSVAAWVRPDIDQNAQFFWVQSSENGADTVKLESQTTGGGRLFVTIADSAGTSFKQFGWDSVFVLGEYRHVVVTWDGTTLKAYADGFDLGLPSTAPIDQAVTQVDSNRQVSVSANFAGSSRFYDGLVHSIGVWDVTLTLPEVVSVFAGGDACINLRKDINAYASSANLQHWWQLGRDLAPNLGKDWGKASNLIDIETNAVGITDADRVTTVPVYAAQDMTLDFDGIQEFMANQTDQLIGIADAFTIAVWANPVDASSSGSMIDIRGSGGGLFNQVEMLQDGSARLTVIYKDNTGIGGSNPAWNGFFTDGVWTHAVIVWNGTVMKAYKNGVDQGTQDAGTQTTGAMADTARTVTIGRREAIGPFFEGQMNSIGVWNKAMDVDEIQALYAAGEPCTNLQKDRSTYDSKANLQHWWELGKNLVPALGKDLGNAAINIDVEVDSVSMFNANRNANLPVFTVQDKSIDFDGTTEHMEGSSELIGIENLWTVGGWFKFDNVASTSGTLFTIGSGSVANRIHVHQRHAGPTGPRAIQLLINNFDNTSILQNVSWQNILNDSVWHHVIIQWDGTTAGRKLYLDGVDQGAPDFISGSTAGVMSDTSRVVSVGRADGGVARHDGSALGMTIWDKYLSSAEIVAIFNAGSADFNLAKNSGNYEGADNLQHWWQLGRDPFLEGVDSGIGLPQIDLLDAAVGISAADRVAEVPPFALQKQSIDFDGSTEFFRNSTAQVIGIADVWSIGVWYKPANLTGTRSIFEINDSDSPSRIIAFFTGTTLNVFLRNSADTINTSVTFSGFGVLNTWAHLYLSWNAAGTGFPSIFKDGSLVAPTTSTSGGALVQADDTRPVGIGTNLNLAAKHSGLISQMSVWRTIQDAAISDLYNGGNPNALDLNSSFGSYAGAGDLAHWWRLGHEASSNLGKDFAEAGFTATIDVEVNSVGITDADRIADVPT